MTEKPRDLSNKLSTALWMAANAHHGQVDKAGEPYILHVTRIVASVTGAKAKQVAALHDIVEDTSVTLDDLRGYGFDEDVIAAVEAISHRPHEPYVDYIDRVAENSLATTVKLADLRDHLTKMTSTIDPDGRLRTKYTRALAILRGDVDVPRPD